MALIANKQDKYITILSDGTLRLPVPEGTEGAVKREYELKDGTKGSKTELVFNKITGKITDIKIFDGDFGKLLQLTITDEAGDMVLSVSTAQNFGEDLMKKLPNIDLDKEVSLAPYAFEDEKGKSKKGVTVTQDEVKIKNYFYDEEKKEVTNGYPKPKGDTTKYSSDKWKIYFLEAREFLTEYIEERFVKKDF